MKLLIPLFVSLHVSAQNEFDPKNQCHIQESGQMFTVQIIPGEKLSKIYILGKESAKIKIDDLKESTLVNFYSLVGINFQNIASNDAMMTSLLKKYNKDGWELIHITSAVESDAGKGDGDGIFISRFYFRKEIK